MHMPEVALGEKIGTVGGLVGSNTAYCPVCGSSIAFVDDFGELELWPCEHTLYVGHDVLSTESYEEGWPWVSVEEVDDEEYEKLSEGTEWIPRCDGADQIDAGDWVQVHCQWDIHAGPHGGSWSCSVAWPVSLLGPDPQAAITAAVAEVQKSDPHDRDR